MRAWVLVCVLLSGLSEQTRVRVLPSSGGGGGFDTSPYRQDTYGAPDHYCDPTRSLASSGTGTIGDAWNLTQCRSQPVCGDVIGILSNGASASAQLPVAGLDYQEQAFHPAVSCTSGNRLVYTTRVAAITLVNLTDPTSSTIGSSTDRSEIRTDGTREQGEVQGTGRAAYGCYENDYITFDGFYVDMASAGINGDQGVISARSDVADVEGCSFLNFAIKGMVTDMDSNAVLWRPGNSLHTTLSNFAVWDFDNQPSGGGLNQQGLFSDQYGDQDYLIEQFLLDSTDRGIFPKGTASGNFNYGTIRYGILRSMTGEALRFNDWDGTSLTTLEYVLVTDYAAACITFGAETTLPRNMLIHHVTCANGSATGGGGLGGIYFRSTASAFTNVTIRDNLIDWTNASAGRGIEAGEISATLPTINYHGYYRAGNTVQWSYNGTDYSTIASWRTATSQEANSQVLGSDPFTNRAAGDFTIAVGSAALTASSTGGQIGAYASGLTVGPIQ